MDRNFENRDFENFVKQNADQYRMFPSEKVWKGINNTLHTRRRWYGVGLILLLISTATVTGLMLSPSSQKQQIASANTSSNHLVNKDQYEEADIIIAPVKPVKRKDTPVLSPDNTHKNLFSASSVVTKKQPLNNNTNTITFETTNNDFQETELLPNLSMFIQSEKLTKTQPKQITSHKTLKTENITPRIIETDHTLLPIPVNETTAEKELTKEDNSIKTRDIYPMTIESVVNLYEYFKPAKKLVWQLYITPSVTYRSLDDNKTFLEAARTTIGASNIYSFTNINSLVKHKPDIGVQIGVSVGYPIAKNLTIKAGLQFNVNSYNIMASPHSSEVATIALNTSGGGTNSVSAITNYRNVEGFRSDWLNNKYISASLPVGAEIKLSGNRKTIIGVGATIQPTYVLGNRAYVLSTDLKNYAEIPSLTRKWNINTGFEIFAGYNTGKVDWRIGPQVRYQLFSSFYDRYPIKEHLFDVGVKLGITIK